ncbi:MAG: methyltransferase family protein [Acidobacteriota bacterium]
MLTNETQWWKGPRGEWYVVIQVFLFMLVIFGPPALPGFPAWDPPVAIAASVIGLILIAAGIIFIAAGLWALRAQLTPLPYPRENSVLIETGPYAIVRHPVYTGGIFMAFGWGLVLHGVLTLLYSLMLLVFLDVKSRREEHWLCERFPAYDAYQKRTRRLIPFLY